MITNAKPTFDQNTIDDVSETLESGQVAQGLQVDHFEKYFAQACGTKYAVAVNSGTAALHAALHAINVGPGDEIITTPFSFVATANVIALLGAKPVFVDINELTYNIDPTKIKPTKKTKAIMPVHLYGLMADMLPLLSFGLPVIEDACQAHLAESGGKKAGSIGRAGAFSFYATKNMSTIEGGCVTTNDESLAYHVKCFRHHGLNKQGLQQFFGYNYRMTDVDAAIGVRQLEKLQANTAKRQKNASLYCTYLEDIPGIVIPFIPYGYQHVFHQYTIRVTKEYRKSRDSLVQHLNNHSIFPGVFYKIPIHVQTPFMAEFGYGPGNFPVAEKAAEEVLSLPVHPLVSAQEIITICELIESFRNV